MNESFPPVSLFEYQLMRSRTPPNEDATMNAFHHLCQLFKTKIRGQDSGETWLMKYTFLYDMMDNPFFVITEEHYECSFEIMEELFINPCGQAFDLRYQAFLNMIEKLPMFVVIKVLSKWLHVLQPSEDRVRVGKVLWWCLQHVDGVNDVNDVNGGR